MSVASGRRRLLNSMGNFSTRFSLKDCLRLESPENSKGIDFSTIPDQHCFERWIKTGNPIAKYERILISRIVITARAISCSGLPAPHLDGAI
jgi:hypothetical protein